MQHIHKMNRSVYFIFIFPCILFGSDRADGIKFTIEPTKEFYVQGEPMVMKFKIENKASEEISVHRISQHDDVSLLRRHQGREEFGEFSLPVGVTSDMAGPFIIPPGEIVESSLLYVSDVGRYSSNRGVLFDEPGKYAFYAKYSPFSEVYVESNRVEVYVSVASNPEAFEEWVRLEEGDFGTSGIVAFLQGYETDARRSRLLKFIDRFPESRYAEIGRYALGINEDNKTVTQGIENLNQTAVEEEDLRVTNASSKSAERGRGGYGLWIGLALLGAAALFVYFRWRAN